jgi:hypothetical protein
MGEIARHHLFHPPPRAESFPLRLALLLAVCAGPAWWIWKHRRAGPRNRPASLALLASGLLFAAWLARDEPAPFHAALAAELWQHPDPADAATHALTLRFTPGATGGLRFSSPVLESSKLDFCSLGHPTTRAAYALAHRAEVDALWADIAPLRAWFDELASQAALADLTRDFDEPQLAFTPLRVFADGASAHALLLALDGRRDEAVEILLPVLAAARKLEPRARTLARRMYAISLQRTALSALRFVVEQGPLGETARTRLQAALAPTQDRADQARLLILCEYPITAGSLCRFPPGETSPPSLLTQFLSRFFYHPVATANAYGDHLQALADAAAARDFASMEAHARELAQNRRPGKNYSGRLLLALVAPDHATIVASFWSVEDERAALLARL